MVQARLRLVEFRLVAAGYWLATPPYRLLHGIEWLCNGFRLGCGTIVWPAC
jgi:hypothetical protein